MASVYNIILSNICHLYNENNQLIGFCAASITPEEMLNKPVELDSHIVDLRYGGSDLIRGTNADSPIIVGSGAITVTGRVLHDAAFVIIYKHKWYMFSLSDLRLRPVVPNPVPNVSYLAQAQETLRRIEMTHPSLLQNVQFTDSGVKIVRDIEHMPNVRHKKIDFAYCSNAMLYKDKICLELDEVACWQYRLTEANNTLVVPDFAKPIEIHGEGITRDVNILLSGGCYTLGGRVDLDLKNCSNVRISLDEYADKMRLSATSCNIVLNTQVPLSGTLKFSSSIIAQNCNNNCTRLRFNSNYVESVSLTNSHLGSPLRLSVARNFCLYLCEVHEAQDSCPLILHNTFEDTLVVEWDTPDDSLIPLVIQMGNTPIRRIVFMYSCSNNERTRVQHFLRWLRDYVSVQLANHVEIILAFKDKSIVQSIRTSPEYKAAKHGISFRSSKFSWKSTDMDSLKRELK